MPYHILRRPLLLADDEITPADLAPFAGWDFSDVSTLWQDTSATTAADAEDDPIRRIDDQVGSHYLETGATSTSPLLKLAGVNGKPAALFDGFDDRMTVPSFWSPVLTAPHSVIIVLDPGTGSEVFFDGGQANQHQVINRFNTTSLLRLYGGASQYYSGPSTDLQISTSVINGASSRMHLNGVARSLSSGASAGTGSLNGITLGDDVGGYNVFLDGYICEVWVYDADVTAHADYAAAIDYLKTKWGIS